MEKLLQLLAEIRPDVDFENETALIDDGILDSFDVVSIISSIDDEYGKIYPSAHSSITTGCIGKAINFNDDIVNNYCCSCASSKL